MLSSMGGARTLRLARPATLLRRGFSTSTSSLPTSPASTSFFPAQGPVVPLHYYRIASLDSTASSGGPAAGTAAIAATATAATPDPIVILHGLLGSSNNWRTIAQRPELCQHRAVYAADLRNHGSSPHAPSMSLACMANDLIALLDRLRIDRAVVIGHSLGGKVAMTAAVLHPQRFSGLVVVDMSPYDYSFSAPSWSGVAQVVSSLQRVDFAHAKTREDVDRQLKPYLSSPLLRGFVLQNVVQAPPSSSPPSSSSSSSPTLQWRINLPVIARTLPHLSSFPRAPSAAAAAALRPCNVPTLFVRGELSDFVLAPQIEAIHAWFARARIETIAGAGHWIHAEKPVEFSRAVQAFLREL